MNLAAIIVKEGNLIFVVNDVRARLNSRSNERNAKWKMQEKPPCGS